jgi:ADP-heptose:LPS heptosyltransferase
MKILIIRFSSFGDVLQTLSVAGRIGESWPGAEIHWITREEFAPLLVTHPRVRRVWTLRKGAGLAVLLGLGRELRAQNFTHVYDAHGNLRSLILGWQLEGWFGFRRWIGQVQILRRPLYRWKRFLLFRLHINRFTRPISGQFALLQPLNKWNLPTEAPAIPQLFLPAQEVNKMRQELPWSEFVTLAPSASYALKRWPLEHWKTLIRLLPATRFVVLGGPEDDFLAELEQVDPARVKNCAGRYSLLQSACVVAASQALVSNDTGLMHVAEQTGKPCLALMGPAPFGFPSRARTEIFEVNLACRPCSKHGQGPCVNPEYQKCMRDILPEQVARSLKGVLNATLVDSLSRD